MAQRRMTSALATQANAVPAAFGSAVPEGWAEPETPGLMSKRAHNRFLTRAQEILDKGREGAIAMPVIGGMAVYADRSFEQVVNNAVAATDRQPHERARAYMQAFEENLTSQANDRLLEAFDTAATSIIDIIADDPTPPPDERHWLAKCVKPLPDE